MPKIASLVHETTTTTGTGALTVAAKNGRVTFNTAFGTGGTDLFFYFVSHQGFAEWERGTGHLSDSTTLVRDTVIASSNADAAVDFSAGTMDVTTDVPHTHQHAHYQQDATPVNPGVGDTWTRLTDVGTFEYIDDGDSTQWVERNVGGGSGTLAKGYLFGLGTSNDTDTAHDILIAVGQCVDSTGTTLMKLTTAIAKQIDAAWAAGDDAGGLDGTESVGGTPDASTTYHLYLISDDSGTTVDAVFSETAPASGPTLPSGYTKYRRIASFPLDGSANVVAYSQLGDEFLLSVPVSEFTTNVPGTDAVTPALSVPLGIQVDAIFAFHLQDDSPAADTNALITAIDQADTAPSATVFTVRLENSTDGTDTGANTGWIRVRTDTSGQIRYHLDNSDGGLWAIGVTSGWIDTRGRVS